MFHNIAKVLMVGRQLSELTKVMGDSSYPLFASVVFLSSGKSKKCKFANVFLDLTSVIACALLVW